MFSETLECEAGERLFCSLLLYLLGLPRLAQPNRTICNRAVKFLDYTRNRTQVV
jgi:hypothetical protein